MARCWEQRGCDADMQAECLHASTPDEKCPTKCAFARCDLPQHEHTWDAALIFDPSPDRTKAIKENCTYCGFFLTKGPKV